ncbi:GGDEF domain-containing protein [Solwaraspora sp. WMMA2065]|uniref:GGDEF domain-containing protein n=1 Tax=Solwaraspora sp. WMMA2065 TaxID=3015166 RepID=UPI00259B4EC8|nr:GGDEF domain-containing protein [Solwaraspora sp. WMMA2065]WJK33142.1 GGDEF domain-containing protein [Solwaraspora sp. WMMA2065]
MSYLHSYLTAVGGLLAGLAAAAPLIVWQRRILLYQRRALADRARDRDRWYRLATRNETTDLPNRRALLTHLDATLSLGEPLGLVLVDLDRFKHVNDVHGHEHGNDLLTEVGRRLSAIGPPVVLAVHLSGDEFALAVHGDTADTAAAAHTAHRRISHRPYDIAGQQISLTASVGYAVAAPHMLSRDLLHAADQAMYLAKRASTGLHAHDPARDTPGPAARYRDLP